jgi:hypothetical protein
MTSTKLNFGDFASEKLSTNQQKMVRGGDGTGSTTDPKDPIKGQGNGSV